MKDFTPLDWIRFSFEILGALVTLYGIYKIVRSKWFILSWRTVRKAAEKTVSELNQKNINPQLIVGISRGGAIFGSLISAHLGYRPLLAITAEHKWQNNQREDRLLIQDMSIKKPYLKSVLIVEASTKSGNSISSFIEEFKKLGAKKNYHCQYCST